MLGNLNDVQEIAARGKATDVLVIAGTLPCRAANLMDDCRQSGLELKIIRRLEDRLSGDHRIPIRDIEISDLLRRAPVQLDTKSIGTMLEGRTVMVTGQAGASARKSVASARVSIRASWCWSAAGKTASSRWSGNSRPCTPRPPSIPASPASPTRRRCATSSNSSGRRSSSMRRRTSTCR